MQDEYSAFIIRKYGVETFEQLLGFKHLVYKANRENYLEWIEHYRNAISRLVSAPDAPNRGGGEGSAKGA
jgi:hypothetical protein